MFIRFTASAFRKLPSIYVFSYFPFGFEGRMWDLIVSVPDHCSSFYFGTGKYDDILHFSTESPIKVKRFLLPKSAPKRKTKLTITSVTHTWTKGANPRAVTY